MFCNIIKYTQGIKECNKTFQICILNMWVIVTYFCKDAGRFAAVVKYRTKHVQLTPEAFDCRGGSFLSCRLVCANTQNEYGLT